MVSGSRAEDGAQNTIQSNKETVGNHAEMYDPNETPRKLLNKVSMGTEFEPSLYPGSEAIKDAVQPYDNPTASVSIPTPESPCDEYSESNQVELIDDTSGICGSNSPASAVKSKQQFTERMESLGPQDPGNYADVELVHENSPSCTRSDSQQDQHQHPPPLPILSAYDSQTGSTTDETASVQSLQSSHEAINSHTVNGISSSVNLVPQQLAQTYISPVCVPPIAAPAVSMGTEFEPSLYPGLEAIKVAAQPYDNPTASVSIPTPESSCDEYSESKQVEVIDDNLGISGSKSPASAVISKQQSMERMESLHPQDPGNENSPSCTGSDSQQDQNQHPPPLPILSAYDSQTGSTTDETASVQSLQSSHEAINSHTVNGISSSVDLVPQQLAQTYISPVCVPPIAVPAVSMGTEFEPSLYPGLEAIKDAAQPYDNPTASVSIPTPESSCDEYSESKQVEVIDDNLGISGSKSPASAVISKQQSMERMESLHPQDPGNENSPSCTGSDSQQDQNQHPPPLPILSAYDSQTGSTADETASVQSLQPSHEAINSRTVNGISSSVDLVQQQLAETYISPVYGPPMAVPAVSMGTEFEPSLYPGLEAIKDAAQPYDNPTASVSIPTPESSYDEYSESKQVEVIDDNLGISGSNSPASAVISKQQLMERMESLHPQDPVNYAHVELVHENSPSCTGSDSQQDQNQHPPPLPILSAYDSQTGSTDDETASVQSLQSSHEAINSRTVNGISSSVDLVQQHLAQTYNSPVYVPPTAVPADSMSTLRFNVGPSNHQMSNQILFDRPKNLRFRLLEPVGHWDYNKKTTVYKATLIPPVEGRPLVNPGGAVVRIKACNKLLEREWYQLAFQDYFKSKFVRHENVLLWLNAFHDAINKEVFCLVLFGPQAVDLRSIINSSEVFKSLGFPEDCIAIALKSSLIGLAHIHNHGHLHGNINSNNIVYFKCRDNICIRFAVSSYISDVAEHNPLHVHDPDSALTFQPDQISDFLPYRDILKWGRAPEVLVEVVEGSEDKYSTRGCSVKSDIWLVGVTALELAFGEIRILHRDELLDIARCISVTRKMGSTWEALLRQTEEFNINFRETGQAQQQKGKSFAKRRFSLFTFSKGIGEEVDGKEAFSEDFVELVAKCLNEDPKRRPTAETLLQCKFLKKAKSLQHFKDVVAAASPLFHATIH